MLTKKLEEIIKLKSLINLYNSLKWEDRKEYETKFNTWSKNLRELCDE